MCCGTPFDPRRTVGRGVIPFVGRSRGEVFSRRPFGGSDIASASWRKAASSATFQLDGRRAKACSHEEALRNSRARSAKLRAAIRTSAPARECAS